jgi:hypothetical protein
MCGMGGSRNGLASSGIDYPCTHIWLQQALIEAFGSGPLLAAVMGLMVMTLSLALSPSAHAGPPRQAGW